MVELVEEPPEERKGSETMTRTAPHHIALLCQVPKAGERGPVKRVPSNEIDTAEWLCEVGLLEPSPEADYCYRRTPLGDRVVEDCLFCVDSTVCARTAVRCFGDRF